MNYPVEIFGFTSRMLFPALMFLQVIGSAAQAQELVNLSPPPEVKYSPYIDDDHPNQVLFGDTHLHTGYSADAGLVGATTSPDDAYRFAKGEVVTTSNGVRARLERPLDFLVVADHAENLGLTFGLAERNKDLLSTEWGQGLAEVWARENTREAIWDALERKEVFATTGTRIRVRVFAGWDFKEADLNRSDFARHGYEHGVPMGGDLRSAAAGQMPVFLVRALRDADGANLDRVQIVKGWMDEDGASHERVYDVAWSGDRQPGADGKLPAVGNTVNVDNATYTNAIGAAGLQAHWRVPDFGPAQRAFYYVRVLEIPTPNWTTYDAAFFGIDRPTGVNPIQQERAYTSPIWYTP